MTSNSYMSHNVENALYINVDNFKKAKEELTKKGIKCTDKKLSEVLSCNLRTIQRYRSGTNQAPIPRLRLEKLAQYMDVSPNWLCGLDDLGGPGYYSQIVPFEKRFASFDQRQILANYLECVKIKSNISNWPNLEDEDSLPFTEISDVPVSYEQFSSYLDEIEAAIEYITGRFIKHIKE